MEISMTPKLEKFVNRKVASGEFGSPSDVIHEALRLMHEVEKERKRELEELRSEIQIGIDDAEQGKVRDAKEAIREVREQYRQERQNSKR
jgi:antitoxin ParD1/3/4